MSDRERCRYCRKPIATDAEYDSIPDGDGAWLCWSPWQGCDQDAEEAIDLRDAEIATERALADRLAESLDKTLQVIAESGDSPVYAEVDLSAWKEARRG